MVQNFYLEGKLQERIAKTNLSRQENLKRKMKTQRKIPKLVIFVIIEQKSFCESRLKHRPGYGIGLSNELLIITIGQGAAKL